MLCNKSLHEVRGPADRGANGECVHCVRDRGRQHAAVRTAAVRLYRGLEARGVVMDLDWLAEGHRLALALDMSCRPHVG